MAIVELKSYKLQRIDKIPAEIIRIGSTTSAEIRKIINYIYKMNELLTLKEDVLNHCYKLHTTLHPKFSYQFLSHIEKKKLLGIAGVFFDTRDITVNWSHVLGSSNTL